MPHWIGKKYSPIGLDLGSTAIRGIQLVHLKNNLEVHSALEQRLDLDLDEPVQTDYETQFDPAYWTDHLKNLLDRGNFIGRDVVLHCPADKLDMRPIELPASGSALPRSAILGALRLQLGGHLPFAVDDAVFDYFFINPNQHSNSTRVMAITAGGEWIKKCIELVESLGLHCLTVDALPCALTRTSAHADSYISVNTPPPKPDIDPENSPEIIPEPLVGILDVGHSGSTLIVRNHNRPIFCRRFSLAGPKMTEIITNRLGVEYNLAENLKQAYGLDCQPRRLRHNQNSHQPESDGAINSGDYNQSASVATAPPTDKPELEIAKTIFAALQSELGHFVKGLTRSLNYVISDHGGARLEKIQLCGSAAHTRNLDHYLAQQFDLPVDIMQHPLLSEIAEYLPSSRAHVGSWTTALGLALLKEDH